MIAVEELEARGVRTFWVTDCGDCVAELDTRQEAISFARAYAAGAPYLLHSAQVLQFRAAGGAK